MAKIIFDIGSGNTLETADIGRYLIDEINKRANKKGAKHHKIIFKAQLFRDQPSNKPLAYDVFSQIHAHATVRHYSMTASVFDIPSLEYLLEFKRLPFIKIACRPNLYWLAGEIPRKIPVYISTERKSGLIVNANDNIITMLCVPKYPAEYRDYVPDNEPPGRHMEYDVISDHTVGLDLFKNKKPFIWEKHLVPEHTADNPDAGPFAVTPEEVEEIL